MSCGHSARLHPSAGRDTPQSKSRNSFRLPQQLRKYKNRETSRSRLSCRSRSTVYTMEAPIYSTRPIVGNLTANNQFCTVAAVYYGERHLFSVLTENKRVPFVPPIKYSDKNSTGFFCVHTRLHQNNLKKIQTGKRKEDVKLHATRTRPRSVTEAFGLTNVRKNNCR